MKTKANWIALVCSIVALAVLVWAGVATARPAPSAWLGNHLAGSSADRPSQVDISAEQGALTYRRVGKAFIAVAAAARETDGEAAAGTDTAARMDTAGGPSRRGVGKGFVGCGRRSPRAVSDLAVAVPMPETRAQLNVRAGSQAAVAVPKPESQAMRFAPLRLACACQRADGYAVDFDGVVATVHAGTALVTVPVQPRVAQFATFDPSEASPHTHKVALALTAGGAWQITGVRCCGGDGRLTHQVAGWDESSPPAAP